MNVLLQATIRRFTRMSLGNSPQNLRLTGIESLAVASVEPDRFELTRSGRRFVGGCQIIANGIAPVAAIPTTTATLALVNTESAGGSCLVIERLGFWLGSGTPAAGATLFGCVSTKPIATQPTAMQTGYGSSNANGGTNYSKALFSAAVTIPSTPAPAWFQVLSTQQLAAGNVGQGDGLADLNGSIVIPPGHALGLGILSGAGTTPLYGISVGWSELEADLE